MFISDCVKIRQKLEGGTDRWHDDFTPIFFLREGNWIKKYELGVAFNDTTFIQNFINICPEIYELKHVDGETCDLPYMC
jgi:hypothetical protein